MSNLKWLKLSVAVIVVICFACGCSVFNTSDLCFKNNPKPHFELTASSENTSSSAIVSSLNDALSEAPHLVQLLSEDDGDIVFINTLGEFKSRYSKLFFRMYPSAEPSDFYYSFTVGYALTKEIIKDKVLFNEEARTILEDYSGYSFEEYALMSGFWVAYHYMKRNSVTDLDQNNNTKHTLSERLDIPFSGEPLGSGLDAKAGLLQLAKASLLQIKVVTPTIETMFYYEDDTWDMLRDNLLNAGLSSGLTVGDFKNKFLEVGLINHYQSDVLIDNQNKELLLGDIHMIFREYSNLIEKAVLDADWEDDLIILFGNLIVDEDFTWKKYDIWRHNRYGNAIEDWIK
jgi:hypothetical protein